MDLNLNFDSLLKENNIFYNLFCLLISEHRKFNSKEAALYWRTVFHSLALAHHGYVGVYSGSLDFASHQNPRIQDLKRYGPRFLTAWNFAFQSVFLILALTHDVAEWCGRTDSTWMKRVRYWRDVVFNGTAVPYTMFVASMFWTLFSIDRELVFPASYDTLIPWWFNLCVHSWILVVIGVEIVLQPRSKPVDQRLQYALCWFFSISYAVVYYTTYFQSGRWLYAIFAVMNWWQICLYQLGIWTSIHLFYDLQWPIIRLIHGDNPEQLVEGNEQLEDHEPIVGERESILHHKDLFEAEKLIEQTICKEEEEYS